MRFTFLVVALLLVGVGCSTNEVQSPPKKKQDPPARTPDASSSSSQPPVTTTPPKDDPKDTTTPRIRFVGRTDGTRVAWPGTRVIVRFKGSALKVKLREKRIDGGSLYDVTIDGRGAEAPFAPNDGEGDYDVATGLDAASPHVVELYRRTEAMVGTTDFVGFEYPSGGELLAPPVWPNRRIEVLGDSEAAGYGIECANASQTFTAATENARKAFPELAGTALEAEVHNVSFSGKGISRNADNDRTLSADLYPLSLPDGKPWEFGSWVPDVVWIALGTNDFTMGVDGNRGPPDHDLVKTKYRDLVALVRSKNPSAHIVCAIPGAPNDDYPQGWSAYSTLKTILTSIVDERRAANDPKVYFGEVPRARATEDATGCDYHPNAAYHQRAATTVTAKIREVTGW